MLFPVRDFFPLKIGCCLTLIDLFPCSSHFNTNYLESHSMQPYSYSKLNIQTGEIRLLNLSPGEFEDAIHITISHEPFVVHKQRPRKEITQDHIDSLPAAWDVGITPENQYIYYNCGAEGSLYCSWTHPDPTYVLNDMSDLVEGPGEPMDIIPAYEALSYTLGSPDNLEMAYIGEHSVTGSSTDMNWPTLEIGKNLACALKHLRYPDRPRVLWVDAIWLVFSLSVFFFKIFVAL
jgi:hypothetical protein